MPFAFSGRGKITYGGVEYYEVDCGGGGNCLFLSLAWLLQRSGADAHATADNLRAGASETLVTWANDGAPDYVDTVHVPLPNAVAAARLAGAGVWGELACVSAVVERLFTAGVDVSVHVLGPNENNVVILRSRRAEEEDPAYTIHVYNLGLVHYRALVADGDLDGIAQDRIVANFETPPLEEGGDARRKDKARKKKKQKLHVSLGGVRDPKRETNSSSIAPGARLEIHHIDVGQGDAALMMIVGPDESIVRSILVDAGPRAQPVTAYFDTLIDDGRFRPIDAFFASHYDSDHIGGAKDILTNGRYTSPSCLAYDGGDSRGDRDFESYKAFVPERSRRRPPLDRPVVADCLGVNVWCIGYNGLVAGEGGRGFFSLLADDDMTGEVGDKGEMELAFYPQDKNDCSLALLVTFGRFSYFTAGDLSGRLEEEVSGRARERVGGHVCVLKAGHHGAAEATVSGTVAALRPRFTVVSCGRGNDHGHPRAAAIARLEDLAAAGIRSEYAVTANVMSEGEVDAADKDIYYPARPGKNGVHGQGHVLVTVTAAQARGADHAFRVATSAGQNATLACGEREVDVDIGDHEDLVGRRPAKFVEERQASSRKRKLEREQAAVDGFTESLTELAKKRVGDRYAKVSSTDKYRASLAKLIAQLQAQSADSDEHALKSNIAVRNWLKGLDRM